MDSPVIVGAKKNDDNAKVIKEQTRVIVVGAGIIGVCIAYHLAARGADVTVLDKQSPGSSCTKGAFAMLIASHSDADDASFNALYGLAVAEWHQLDAQLTEQLPIQWGGLVHWTRPGKVADELSASRARLRSWGVRVEELGAASDLTRLVPGAIPGPMGAGSFLPDHGAVAVEHTFSILLRQAKALGVKFETPTEVSSIRTHLGKPAVVTGDGAGEKIWTADKIVIAAGAGTTALAETVGAHVPLDIVSGTLAYSKPMPPVLHRTLNGPLGAVRQDPDGRVVTGLDYAPGAGTTDVSNAYGQILLQRAADVLPALAGMELDEMVVGYVPIPKDTRPIVGFCDGPNRSVYVATMMSGITMAPLMGRLVAAEVLGQTLALLEPYRPGRFSMS